MKRQAKASFAATTQTSPTTSLKSFPWICTLKKRLCWIEVEGWPHSRLLRKGMFSGIITTAALLESTCVVNAMGVADLDRDVTALIARSWTVRRTILRNPSSLKDTWYYPTWQVLLPFLPLLTLRTSSKCCNDYREGVKRVVELHPIECDTTTKSSNGLRISH